MNVRRALAVILTAALAATGCGPGGNARVTVPSGATMRIAADSLEAAGVIGSARVFGLYAKLTKRDRQATPMLSAFDFDQEPREPTPLPLRDDCEGPIYFES